MSYSVSKLKKPTLVNASIIFALIILAAYLPLIITEQTYFRNSPIPPEFLGYQEKSTIFGNSIDQLGSGNWPRIKLSTDLLLEGKIPLWDPYLGIGQPLAADTTHHIFSPLNLGFFLPVQLWDTVLLITLWVAGVFTFLFLRNLRLSFAACISGGIFYMLSGGFAWYMVNPDIFVMAFTPFILYSLEKIIQNKNLKFIPLASIAFAFAILGAHLESLVLQFLLVGTYFCYRIIYLTLLHRWNKQAIANSIKNNLFSDTTKRKASWPILALIGGLGLTAFFILPALEFIKSGVLEHNTSYAELHYNPISLSSGFIPYILGELHAYWTQDVTNIALWGYVGIFALYFSILGVWLSLRDRDNEQHKYTPLFFMMVAFLSISRIANLPVATWIGHLPILNMISFGNYAGVIIPIAFSISAAFGINSLTRGGVKIKKLAIVFLITILITLILLVPVILHLLSPNTKFPSHITVNDAKNYVGFQILQSLAFSAMVLFSAIAVSRNKFSIGGLIMLVILELSLYIPLGLHPIWMAYKGIIIISGMAIITFLILRQSRSLSLTKPKNSNLYVIILVVIVTISAEVIISESSPFGMLQRYDSFQQNPVTNFLKENSEYSRIFSFDDSLEANYPSAYKISSISQFTPFNTASFYSFIHNFLDKEADHGRFGYPPWDYTYGPMGSIEKFFENKKYFDFLGVKYILTEGYDFNTIAPAVPGASGQSLKIESHENSTGQSFISPVESISVIGVSLGTYQVHDQGSIILTLDSVPRDEKYHRESILNETLNKEYNEFKIVPPLNNIKNKEFYFSLRYPQEANGKLAVVFIIGSSQPGFDFIRNNLGGKFYEKGVMVEGKQMVFSIKPNSEKFSTVFRFHNINIYENNDAFPRSFLVNRFLIVDKDKAQDFLLENPTFDLRHKVILEEQLPKDYTTSLNSSLTDIQSNAKIITYSSDKVLIHTNDRFASLLVLTDIYYPGWKVTVDGQDSHLYRADSLVRAVFVPSGEHLVEFSYVPQSFVIGLIISLVTAAILLSLFVYSKKSVIS